MADEPDILSERRGAVGIVTMNRPQAMNSVTAPMCDRLVDACNAFNDDPDVRVIVITGAGDRAFCAGLDLKENDLADARRRSPYRMMHYDEHPFVRLRRLAKPTIAAVNGVAVGAGLGISLACDMRFMADTARFGAVFTKMAMPPQDCVAAYLPQIVALPKALDMILTGRMVPSAEALEIGLANEVVPAASLIERVMEMAETIAKGPPMALAMAKQVVYRSLHKPIDDQMAMQNLGTFLNMAYAKHDVEEAVAAFMGKREAVFRGP